MSNKSSSTIAEGVLIGREHWDIPVRVELRPYLNFIRRIDCQLHALEERWSHTASPSAKNYWNQPRGVGVKGSSLQPPSP